jgi:hypothetical protein
MFGKLDAFIFNRYGKLFSSILNPSFKLGTNLIDIDTFV